MPTPVSKKWGKTDEFKYLMFALYLVFQSVYLVLFLGIQHTSLLKSQCIFQHGIKAKANFQLLVAPFESSHTGVTFQHLSLGDSQAIFSSPLPLFPLYG